MLQKARNKARKLAEKAERVKNCFVFQKLDTLSVTSAILDLANATDDLANAKGNLFETKLKVDAYNKIIIREPLSTDENPTRKRKHSNRLKTPPRRPLNNDALLDTPNKRQMSDEKVIHHWSTVRLLCRGLLRVCFPQILVVSVILEGNNFAIHLQKSDDEFKMEILREIEGDEGNMFRLYCENFNGLL